VLDWLGCSRFLNSPFALQPIVLVLSSFQYPLDGFWLCCYLQPNPHSKPLVAVCSAYIASQHKESFRV
jgi:hypothetical protein